jgi:hypothetical protein
MKHNSYHIGDIFTNQDLMDTFGVSNSGGMRRSLANNCLLLIHKADSIYHDRWENGILKYTGMGLKGDQDINFHQNKTLSQSKTSGIQVLLFDNLKTNCYKYIGEVELADNAYEENQKGENNQLRKVIIFPLKLK